MNEARRTAAVSPGEENGLTDAIKIDFASIPDHVRDEVAAATLESVRSFLRQPGGRERLNARKAAKKSAATTAAK
ncbi:MAG: hypothetical protein K9L62_00215 [Vallitaleaceae bacterium]|nr:hypothetical protein [Vallitaleaceae bacterium]